MKQDTKRFTSIIISILLLVAALVLYFEFIIPAYTSLEGLKGQEQSEQTLLANENKVVTEVQSLLATYQNDSSSSQSVALALPVGQDVAGALAQVYGIAANSNVTVQGVAISVQAVQSASPSTANAAGQVADAATAGAIVKPVGTVSLQLNGTASYENFKTFLQGLATNIRIFDVNSISLQPVGTITTSKSASAQDIFNYGITVVTYYQSP